MAVVFPTAQAPTLANGIVYLGGQFGYLYATRASDGKLLWQAQVANDGLVQPVVANGVVYVFARGRSSATVAAFDAQSGARRWLKNIGGAKLQIPKAPLVAGNDLIFATQQMVVALRMLDGGLDWSVDITLLQGQNERNVGDPFISLAAGNGVIYVAAQQLAALRLSNGTVLWQQPFPGVDHFASPVVSGNALLAEEYLIPPQAAPGIEPNIASFVAVNASTGETLWQTKPFAPTLTDFTVAHGVIYGGWETREAAPGPSNAGAWRADTGVALWQVPVPDIIIFFGNSPAPVVADDVVYLGGMPLVALAGVSHARRWQFQFPARQTATPGAVSAGMVYVANSGNGGGGCGGPAPLVDGSLAALDAATGQVIWQSQFSGGTVK